MNSLYMTKKFKSELIQYDEVIEEEGFFTRKKTIKVVSSKRYETHDELVNRVLDWINENQIADFKIITLPLKNKFSHRGENHLNRGQCIECFDLNSTVVDIFVIYRLYNKVL